MSLSEQCTCSFKRNSVYRHILQYPLILLSGQLKPLIESANAQAGQAFVVRIRALLSRYASYVLAYQTGRGRSRLHVKCFVIIFRNNKASNVMHIVC